MVKQLNYHVGSQGLSGCNSKQKCFIHVMEKKRKKKIMFMLQFTSLPSKDASCYTRVFANCCAGPSCFPIKEQRILFLPKKMNSLQCRSEIYESASGPTVCLSRYTEEIRVFVIAFQMHINDLSKEEIICESRSNNPKNCWRLLGFYLSLVFLF